MRKICILASRELHDDRFIYGLILFYLFVANVILLPAGHFFANIYIDYLISLAVLDILALPALVVAGLLLRSLIADPRHPMAWFLACFDRKRIARILAGFVLLLAFVPFMATFTAMKSFIGLDGFTADVPLADIDRWLHFGVDPAVFLHGIINYAAVWRFFAVIYGPGWMLWVNGFVFWMAVASPRPGIRQRFFIGYVFAWSVLGNFVAWLAISAGPAFFAEVTGDASRFASVLATIDAHELPTGDGIRNIQAYLWDLHISKSSGFGMGISAFPSLHVAMVMLCALAAFEIDRVLAVAGVAIVAFTEMGSVLFGWHYAIDGYFSIAVMTALWMGIRRSSALSHLSFGQLGAAFRGLQAAGAKHRQGRLLDAVSGPYDALPVIDSTGARAHHQAAGKRDRAA